MQSNEKNVWFPAKKYGWGWGLPCAWQGWVVFVVFVGMLWGGSFIFQPSSHHLGPWITYCVLLAMVVLTICFIKGEKPRWRWGDGENRPSRPVADRLTELEELRRQRLVSESEYEAKRQQILREM